MRETSWKGIVKIPVSGRPWGVLLCYALWAAAFPIPLPAQTPEWIWHAAPEGEVGSEDIGHFRKSFRTPPYLWNSRLTVSADDAAEVFLNGVSIARCERWDRPVRTEVTVRLNQGDNVIAVRARNRAGSAGLLVHLNLGGEQTLASDGSWLASPTEEPGWTTLAFNAAHWSTAKTLGPHGMAPWGDVLLAAAATSVEDITVPPGFQVELLRSAQPGEGSWVCLAFDAQGRILLSPQEEDRPLLRLTLREGRVERVEPVAEAIRQAMGFLWALDSLFINGKGPQGTGLYRLQDANGDDRFTDDEIQLLVGYRGGGEHGYHAVRLGSDGKIYILNGNGTQLPADLSPKSAHRNYAQDGLALGMDGNQMPRPEGYILRGDPEGKEWELWLGGLRNPYDFDFNPDGELFAFDSDMEWDWGAPWYRPTRIVHCVSGADFGWREERRVWSDHYEDSLPAAVNVGLGSPTGVEFGTRSRFPEKYRRALFLQDWSYGRILTAHLEPEGASYRGTLEPFLRGRPLNVTDLAFGPDGALYFTTGGRGTQAGLYRVSWKGNPPADTVLSATDSAASARALRRELERFHGRIDPRAVEVLWPHLGSRDRFIRHAARVALEHQPVEQWRERALTETKATAALTALLALARTGPPESQALLLDALSRFSLETIEESDRLIYYRVLALSFLRQGRPNADLADQVSKTLSRHYPASTWPQNRELVRLLTWLKAPDVVPSTLALLESAPTQEQQLHYVEQLRHVASGWSLEDRRRYFRWWTRPRENLGHPPELRQWFAEVDRDYVDGAWMDRFLSTFRRDALATLSGPERSELAALLDTPMQQARLVPSHPRSFVRAWTMDDLLPHLSSEAGDRDYERGRQAFVDAQCLACHRLGNDGGSLGPELNSAGSKYDRRSLLESILEPSKVLNEQYLNQTLRLANGDEITGRVVSESDDQIIVETNPFGGGREEIARRDIRDLETARLSPMPEGLVNILTRDEILDLLAYLESSGRKFGAAANPGAP